MYLVMCHNGYNVLESPIQFFGKILSEIRFYLKIVKKGPIIYNFFHLRLVIYTIFTS